MVDVEGCFVGIGLLHTADELCHCLHEQRGVWRACEVVLPVDEGVASEFLGGQCDKPAHVSEFFHGVQPGLCHAVLKVLVAQAKGGVEQIGGDCGVLAGDGAVGAHGEGDVITDHGVLQNARVRLCMSRRPLS